MLKFKYVLLTSFLLLLFVMTSCSPDSDDKTFEMEIINASNSPYLLLYDFDTNFVYTGDNYGIGVEFIKEPKESLEEYYEAETLIKSGRLVETSDKTYEITLYFIAGKIPSGFTEDTVTEGHVFQSLTLSGNYGKKVIVEWNGENFKQVK